MRQNRLMERLLHALNPEVGSVIRLPENKQMHPESQRMPIRRIKEDRKPSVLSTKRDPMARSAPCSIKSSRGGT